MHIDEIVSLEKYTPLWPVQFLAEKDRLQAALNAPSPCIEHIGSTSIAGMTAKPIIDILFGVEQYPPPNVLTETVTQLGYVCHGECGVHGRIYFTRRSGERKFNLRICLLGGNIWNDNILLREYLKAHPNKVREYSALKETNLSHWEIRLLEYSSLKADFISDMLRSAKPTGQGDETYNKKQGRHRR